MQREREREVLLAARKNKRLCREPCTTKAQTVLKMRKAIAVSLCSARVICEVAAGVDCNSRPLFKSEEHLDHNQYHRSAPKNNLKVATTSSNNIA